MNTILFDSTLSKFGHIKKQDTVTWQMQLKVTEDTSIRTFPQQFKGDIDFNGAFDVSAVNDAWDKLIIPVSDYNLTYNVTFSELNLDAKLISITAVRKETKPNKLDPGGIWITEYTLTFTCDPDKDMIDHLILFEKRKEEDPETGKKVVMQYPTKLEPPTAE